MHSFDADGPWAKTRWQGLRSSISSGWNLILPHLWIQEEVAEGRLIFDTVHSMDTLAEILTKALESESLSEHFWAIDFQLERYHSLGHDGVYTKSELVTILSYFTRSSVVQAPTTIGSLSQRA